MPVRKIRGNKYSTTAYVSTRKAAVSQSAESSLERDFFTLLEYDMRIERYVAQPFTIHWRDRDGRNRRYTPDVAVKYGYSASEEDPHLRTTIFEVKPSAVLRAKWDHLKPIYRAAIGWAREFNCRFHLVTERQIRTPYLENVRFLLRYTCQRLEDDRSLIAARQEALLETLKKLKTTTPQGLLEAVTWHRPLQAELIPWIWNLINRNRIGVDLNKPLTMSSPIWWIELELWDGT